MIRLAMMKATGAITGAAGSLYGRFASGNSPRSAPSDSGAPAYISTLAEVTSPTKALQLGNGSRNTRPARKARIRLTHGMPFLPTLPKTGGWYRFRDRPYPTRDPEATWTGPVPAGEMNASSRRIVASQASPDAPAMNASGPLIRPSLLASAA